MSQILPYRTPDAMSPKPRRRYRGLAGWFLFISLAIVLVILISQRHTDYVTIPLSEFDAAFKAGNVQEIIVEGDDLHGKFYAPKMIAVAGGTVSVRKFQTSLPTGTINWQFMEWLLTKSASTRIEAVNNNNFVMQMVVPLIPWILIFLFVWFFVFRGLRAKMVANQPAPVIPASEAKP